jgi:predicted transcriptional regulator
MDMDTVYRISELVLVLIGIGGILYRLGRMTEKFEQIGKQQASEISDLKDAVKELVKSNARLERMEERQLSEGKRLDRLEARINQYVNGLSQRD